MDEFTAAAEDAADYLHKAHGIQPAYEDPPHAEFSEDQVSSASQNPVLINSNSIENDRDAAGDDDDGALEYVADAESRDDLEES